MIGQGYIFQNNSFWNSSDSSTLSFSGLSMSIVALIYPYSTKMNIITAKYQKTEAEGDTVCSGNREYVFGFDENNKLFISCYDNDYTTVSAEGAIGIRSVDECTSDIGSWHTYVAIKRGSSFLSDKLVLYKDGVVISTETKEDGSTYSHMRDTTSILSNFQVLNNDKNYIGQYKILCLGILNIELTAIQIKRLDTLLRGYAGVSI